MKLAHRTTVLGTETAFEVLAKAKALEAQGKDIVHLHIGAPDFETPPNIVEAATWAGLTFRQAWRAARTRSISSTASRLA